VKKKQSKKPGKKTGKLPDDFQPRCEAEEFCETWEDVAKVRRAAREFRKDPRWQAMDTFCDAMVAAAALRGVDLSHDMDTLSDWSVWFEKALDKAFGPIPEPDERADTSAPNVLAFRLPRTNNDQPDDTGPEAA